MNEPIVLAGHSHATALGVYVDTPDFVHRLLPVRNEDPRFEGFTGFWPRQENYWNSLAKVVAGRRVALLWDGNQHNAIWLFSRGVVFDVALREMPELPIHPGAAVVPRAMLLARFAPELDQLRDVIARLRKGGAGEVMLVGTPPPKGVIAAERGYLAAEPYYAEFAAELGLSLDQLELTPPTVRLKLWQVVQSEYARLAGELGLTFLPVPASLKTADGFLRRQYWADDVAHANDDYGHVMRDAIAEAFSLLPTVTA